MIITLESGISREEAEGVLSGLRWMGFTARLSVEKGCFTIAVIQGVDALTDMTRFVELAHVREVSPFQHPFKLAAREFRKRDTVISIKGFEVGSGTLAVIAGPCAVESREQLMETGRILAEENVRMLRGGAFKPRTSPYSFQGLGEEGLKLMKEVAEKYDLITVSEVMDGEQIEMMSDYVDVLQIGARNMQNFTLLKKLGKTGCAIFLKRGLSATYQDLLMSAEYILDKGNPNVMLCERGVRTFETHSRNTLDIAAVPILHELTHLPVFVDPSHGTGIRSMVPPMAYAAVAAGADGVMVEVHPTPDRAMSDKQQTIGPELFSEMMCKIRTIGSTIGVRVP
ncbi:MAG: 3-deoxy-7-phosphoheptulonate synthase [Simkaniaceae bacterium]|nr:3-deoxy-7-phosphoheptulonate synthase [Simkaniaceae bacterium]